MVREAPAFQFYAEDFMTGTLDMSPAEVGIYIRWLCHQWSHGYVPDDQCKLQRISGANSDEFSRSFSAVRAKFVEVEPGRLINRRLQTVREEQLENAKRRSEAGKRGANSRWQTHATANGSRNGTYEVEEGVIKEEKGTRKNYPDSFEQFWQAYPKRNDKRVGKLAAYRRWQKLTTEEQNLATLAASNYASSKAAASNYAKDPERFLKDRFWEDWVDGPGDQASGTARPFTTEDFV